MKPTAASETAVLIARAILMADATPRLRPMVLEGSAAASRRLLAEAGRNTPWLLKSRAAHAVLFAIERWLLPGVLLHWLARKQLLDLHARDAIEAGCTQLAVLGAGFDTLAWRMRDAAVSFELDHPATQPVKRRTLPEGVNYVAIDLMEGSAADALRRQPNFDPSRPTFFVAEGLLMYLSPERVQSVFAELASVSAPGSRFAFTFMEARAGRPLAFQNASPLITWWLRWRGEPFRWGIERAGVQSFVARHGWRLQSSSSPEELRRRFLEPAGLGADALAVGESVALTHLETL